MELVIGRIAHRVRENIADSWTQALNLTNSQSYSRPPLSEIRSELQRIPEAVRRGDAGFVSGVKMFIRDALKLLAEFLEKAPKDAKVRIR